MPRERRRLIGHALHQAAVTGEHVGHVVDQVSTELRPQPRLGEGHAHTVREPLAQGAGRLIRRADDRGVVAVLDPRLVTARYGNFLRASMPPFWTTTDREMAVGALRRLGE